MTGKEIHNPLNSAKILRLKSRNPQDKKYSKIAYYINGSWYFNETNTFSSSEKRVLVLFSSMERLLIWSYQPSLYEF